jgi:hypothetical protein
MPTLEEKLDALIASQDHVRPDEVTLEHIRQVRDQNGKITYDFSTRYGGFNRRHGKVLTPSQALGIINSAYRFLRRYGRKR